MAMSVALEPEMREELPASTALYCIAAEVFQAQGWAARLTITNGFRDDDGYFSPVVSEVRMEHLNNKLLRYR